MREQPWWNSAAHPDKTTTNTYDLYLMAKHTSVVLLITYFLMNPEIREPLPFPLFHFLTPVSEN